MSSLGAHGATFYKLLAQLSEIPDLLAKLHEEELDKLRGGIVEEIAHDKLQPTESSGFQDCADVEIEVASTSSANELIPMETEERYPYLTTHIATNNEIAAMDFEEDATHTITLPDLTTTTIYASRGQDRVRSSLTISHRIHLAEIREVWIPHPEKLRAVLETLVPEQLQRYSSYKPPRPSDNLRSLSTLILEAKWKRFVCQPPVHPESLFRNMWDMLAVSFLAYDSLMVPLQLIVDIDDTAVIDWMIAIFWTLDMLVTSCTRVYVNGELVPRIHQILCQYAKTWLCFDACLVGLEWSFLISQTSTSDEASITGLRSLRALRFVRLLRLVKVRKFIRQLQGIFNSVLYLLLFDIIKSVVFIVFCNHVIACVWYWIGQSTGDDGWVARTQTGSMPVSYKYLTSMHWSISQFHGTMEIRPYTTRERLYAVMIVLVGFIASTLLVSSMTQAMVKLMMIHSEQYNQNRMVKRYLEERKISRHLCESVKKFLRYAERQDDGERQEEASIKVFGRLPLSMLMDIHEEARAHHLLNRVLFNDINRDFPRVIRHICHEAISETSYSADHHVFSMGDVWNHAMIVEHGTMLYYTFVAGHADSLQASRKTITADDAVSFASCIRIKQRRWICEASLWLSWECCGRLVPQSYVNTLEIKSEDLARTMRKHDKCFVMAYMYARKLQALVKEAPSDVKDYHLSLYIDQEDWDEFLIPSPRSPTNSASKK